MIRRSLAPALAALAFAVPATPALAQEIEGLQVAPQGTVLSINTSGRSSQKPDLAMFTAGVATTGQDCRRSAERQFGGNEPGHPGAALIGHCRTRHPDQQSFGQPGLCQPNTVDE